MCILFLATSLVQSYATIKAILACFAILLEVLKRLIIFKNDQYLKVYNSLQFILIYSSLRHNKLDDITMAQTSCIIALAPIFEI